MGIKLHERYFKVNEAGAEIDMAISKIASESELTIAEIVQILAEQIMNYNKYAIRYERHGNTEQKANEA